MTGNSLSIFTHADELSIYNVSLCMIAIIVFTMLFEWILHKIEHRITQHSHYTRILSAVYKELMILGFISFAILIVEQSYGISFLLELEFAHVWVFGIAIIFILHVLIYMWVTRKDKRHYDVIRFESIDRLIELVKADREAAAKHTALHNFFFYNRHLQHQAEFHILKSLFIHTYNLEEDFDFAKYLRRSMSHFVTQQLDIHESTWCIVIFLLAANILRVYLQDRSKSTTLAYSTAVLWMYFAIGYVLLLMGLIVYYSIHRSKKRLLQKVGAVGQENFEAALLRSLQNKPCWHLHRHHVARAASQPHGNIQLQRQTSLNQLDKTTAVAVGDANQRPIIHSYSHSHSHSHSHHHPHHSGAVSDAVHDSLADQFRPDYLPSLIDGLFAFNSPQLIARCFAILMVLQSFFIALILILHFGESIEYFRDSEAVSSVAGLSFVYLFGSLLPHLILLFWFQPRAISMFVMINSIANVDRKVLDNVFVSMIENDELRYEIGLRMKQICEKDNLSVQDLFQLIDSNGDKSLNITELQDVLEALKIFLSPQQARRLMRAANIASTGKLNFNEFQQFFFPAEADDTMNKTPTLPQSNQLIHEIHKRNHSPRSISQLQPNSQNRQSFLHSRPTTQADVNNPLQTQEMNKTISSSSPSSDAVIGAADHSSNNSVVPVVPRCSSVDDGVSELLSQSTTMMSTAASTTATSYKNKQHPRTLRLINSNYTLSSSLDDTLTNLHLIQNTSPPKPFLASPALVAVQLDKVHSAAVSPSPQDLFACFGNQNTTCSLCKAEVSISKVMVHLRRCPCLQHNTAKSSQSPTPLRSGRASPFARSGRNSPLHLRGNSKTRGSPHALTVSSINQLTSSSLMSLASPGALSGPFASFIPSFLKNHLKDQKKEPQEQVNVFAPNFYSQPQSPRQSPRQSPTNQAINKHQCNTATATTTTTTTTSAHITRQQSTATKSSTTTTPRAATAALSTHHYDSALTFQRLQSAASALTPVTVNSRGSTPQSSVSNQSITPTPTNAIQNTNSNAAIQIPQRQQLNTSNSSLNNNTDLLLEQPVVSNAVLSNTAATAAAAAVVPTTAISILQAEHAAELEATQTDRANDTRSVSRRVTPRHIHFHLSNGEKELISVGSQSQLQSEKLHDKV